MSRNTAALKAANEAARTAFDGILDASNASATMSVPHDVVMAATSAYLRAGGAGNISVRGHGNTTHPVCSVSVVHAK